MKLLVDIQESDANFGIKVLESLSFVKKVSTLSGPKAEIWEDLNAAAEEVRLHKEGKLKLKTAAELLDEL